MKNLKFLLLPFVCLVMAISFVSCDKDNDPDNPDQTIIGTWLCTLPEHGSFYYMKIKFNSDGTYLYKAWAAYEEDEPKNWEDKGTWEIDGEYYYEDGRRDGYKYSLEGDTLIIYDYEAYGPNIFKRVKK